jgi:hypothetical protein
MQHTINKILNIDSAPICDSIHIKHSQTCIKRSPLGQRKSGLIRQVKQAYAIKNHCDEKQSLGHFTDSFHRVNEDLQLIIYYYFLGT